MAAHRLLTQRLLAAGLACAAVLALATALRLREVVARGEAFALQLSADSLAQARLLPQVLIDKGLACAPAAPDPDAAARAESLEVAVAAERLGRAAAEVAALQALNQEGRLRDLVEPVRKAAQSLPRLRKAEIRRGGLAFFARRNRGGEMAIDLGGHMGGERDRAGASGGVERWVGMNLPGTPPAHVSLLLEPPAAPTSTEAAARARCAAGLETSLRPVAEAAAAPADALTKELGGLLPLAGLQLAAALAAVVLLGVALLLQRLPAGARAAGGSAASRAESLESAGRRLDLRIASSHPAPDALCETSERGGTFLVLLASCLRPAGAPADPAWADGVRASFRELAARDGAPGGDDLLRLLETAEGRVAEVSGWTTGLRACAVRLSPALDVVEIATLGAPYPRLVQAGKVRGAREALSSEHLSASSLVRSGVLPLLPGTQLLLSDRVLSEAEQAAMLLPQPAPVPSGAPLLAALAGVQA
jgi:hypothetical protein